MRRLYLGLEGDGDEGLLRMLQLVDAMKMCSSQLRKPRRASFWHRHEGAMMQEAVKKLKASLEQLRCRLKEAPGGPH